MCTYTHSTITHHTSTQQHDLYQQIMSMQCATHIDMFVHIMCHQRTHTHIMQLDPYTCPYHKLAHTTYHIYNTTHRRTQCITTTHVNHNACHATTAMMIRTHMDASHQSYHWAIHKSNVTIYTYITEDSANHTDFKHIMYAIHMCMYICTTITYDMYCVWLRVFDLMLMHVRVYVWLYIELCIICTACGTTVCVDVLLICVQCN